MRIINAYINWSNDKDDEFPSELVVVLDGELPNDTDDPELWGYSSVFLAEENATIYHGARPDGFVRIYWDKASTHGREPYTTVINVNGDDIEIKDPAASSCGNVNWFCPHSMDASFVDKEGNAIELDYYTHLTINKAVEILKTYIPGVKLIRRINNEYQTIEYIIEREDANLSEDDDIIL